MTEIFARIDAKLTSIEQLLALNQALLMVILVLVWGKAVPLKEHDYSWSSGFSLAKALMSAFSYRPQGDQLQSGLPSAVASGPAERFASA